MGSIFHCWHTVVYHGPGDTVAVATIRVHYFPVKEFVLSYSADSCKTRAHFSGMFSSSSHASGRSLIE